MGIIEKLHEQFDADKDARIARLEAELAKARAALEPFDKFGRALCSGKRRQVPTSGEWYGLDAGTPGEAFITIEMFQAAGDALARPDVADLDCVLAMIERLPVPELADVTTGDNRAAMILRLRQAVRIFRKVKN